MSSDSEKPSAAKPVVKPVAKKPEEKPVELPAFEKGLCDKITEKFTDKVEVALILDDINERRGYKTLIIISHRNNTVKYCDLVYVMEQGMIIDQGPYKKIMEKHQYLKENKLNY